MQEELNHVCADFELEKMELMSAYDPENLTNFAKHANCLEAQIRSIIENGGGIIKEYHNAEEFLNEV